MNVRYVSKRISLLAKGQREEFANIMAKLKEQEERITLQLEKQEKSIDENKKQLEMLAKEVTILQEKVSKFADAENKNISSLRKATEEIRRNSAEAVWQRYLIIQLRGQRGEVMCHILREGGLSAIHICM